LVPNDIWLSAFSYLDMKDLLKASHVCKLWHEIAQADILWQRWADAFQENVPIDRAKRKAKAFFNISKGRFLRMKYSMAHDGVYGMMTVTPKGAVYVIYKSAQWRDRSIVWNVETSSGYTLEEIKESGSDTIYVKELFYEDFWVRAKFSGSVDCFDLNSGRLAWQLSLGIDRWVHGLDGAKIAYDGQYFALATKEQIQVRDVRSGGLVSNVALEPGWHCTYLALSRHCLVWEEGLSKTDTRKLFLQAKADWAIYFSREHGALATYVGKDYLVRYVRNNRLLCQRLGATGLSELSSIELEQRNPMPRGTQPTLCFADNLLAVCHLRFIALYDIRSGRALFYKERSHSFRTLATNGSKIVERQQAKIKNDQQSIENREYKYIVYDFEQGSRQTDAANIKKKRCLIS